MNLRAFFRASFVSLAALLGCVAPLEEAAELEPLEELGETTQASLEAPDVDGDGITDTLTYQLNGIVVRRGGSNATRFYPFSGTYAVNNVVDTDGVAGDELVVVHGGGITIIRDRNHTSRLYNFSGNFGVFRTISDLDNTPGGEVIVSHGNGITIIRDRTQTSRLYSYSGSFAINAVAETDGQPGDEVVVVLNNALSIITHRTQSTRLYSLGATYTIHSVVDTDGNAGKDILLHITSGTSRGVSIVHPASTRTSRYPFAGNFLEITRVANTDGLPGSEVELRYQTSRRARITDRTQTVTQL
jgi:hypothetical protein